MNQMSTKRRTQVVAALCEGNSVRATVRMTGAAKGTVLKLLADLGAACLDYQREVMVDLPCERVLVRPRGRGIRRDDERAVGAADAAVWEGNVDSGKDRGSRVIG